MYEFRTMTVQFVNDRWVGWLGLSSTHSFSAVCCEDGHSTCEEAAEHAAKALVDSEVRAWSDAAKVQGTWANEVLTSNSL